MPEKESGKGKLIKEANLREEKFFWRTLIGKRGKLEEWSMWSPVVSTSPHTQRNMRVYNIRIVKSFEQHNNNKIIKSGNKVT